MTRKLDEWRLKKNTTSAERKSYVQEIGRPGNPHPDGNSGVRVTPAKLDRWKKSLAKEGVGGGGGSMKYRIMSISMHNCTTRSVNITDLLYR
jgi:hypothetical protein